VAGGDVTFADDTPVITLAPDTGKAQAARLWTSARDVGLRELSEGRSNTMARVWGKISQCLSRPIR